MQTVTIIRPDDWHLHLRDGAAIAALVPYAAERFGRGIIMPNLKPPVTTTELAAAYRERIIREIPEGSRFQPLMTLYLTDTMPPEEIDRAEKSGFIQAIKLYPAGATTNSEAGVTAIEKVYPVLEAMERLDMVLCVHGEYAKGGTDIFDREQSYIDRVLSPLTRKFSGLRIVFEHITTRAAVDFVKESGRNIAATVTAHHLLFNRNAMFTGGIRPHYYCQPILQREKHRQALLEAVTSGSGQFFLGTDSAPHARGSKETDCGCAGCFTCHAGIEFYADAFEAAGALDKLEAFASLNGPLFYRLPRNDDTITLVKDPWTIPDSYDYLPGDPIVPLHAGETVGWRISSASA